MFCYAALDLPMHILFSFLCNGKNVRFSSATTGFCMPRDLVNRTSR